MTDTKKVLEQVEKTMQDYQGKIENRIKDLMTEKSSAAENESKTLKDELEKVSNSLEQVQKQIKNLGIAGVSGLGDELKKTPFSWTNYVRALYEISDPSVKASDPWKEAAFEKEVVDEYAKTKQNYATDGTAGGYLIPPEVSTEIIDLAMASIPLLNMLPVKKVTGLRGDLPIPKITGRPTAYWCGENTKPTASEATYGEIIGRPKRLAGFTKQSKRLIYQSRNVSDKIIKELLSQGISLKLHEGLLKGTGSDYQPKGLTMYQSDFTANGVSLGTNGGRFTVTDAGLMKMAIDAANEGNDNLSNYGFLMRPEIKWGMKTERIQQFAGQNRSKGQPVSAGKALLADSDIMELVGKLATTTQLSNDISKGASSTLSKVIYGNWAYFWMMMWEGLTVRVSDQAGDGSTGSAFLQNQLYIVAEQEVDCAVTRGAAFTMNQEAETTATNW